MAKRIPPKPTHRKRSPFYWWRRFPTHKPLHHSKPLIDRIKNGDLDYPPYFEQAKWEDYWAEQEVESKRHLFQDQQNFIKEANDIRRRYIKRKNLLIKDGYEAEEKRLKEIAKQFSNTFDSEKSEVYQFMESFDGTIEEMYYAYAEYKGIKNVSLLKLIPTKKRRGRPPKNHLIQ